MRLGICGTYSAGKTITALALSHYTGIPRTQARTMREILPEAAPGRTLEQCTSAQLLQMVVVRHCERAVQESRLSAGFISDGASLQEWIYATVRVRFGINPNASADLAEGEAVERTAELGYFEEVVAQLGLAFQRHVKATYDGFVHLRNELPLAPDGHRPVNERFRSMSDVMLLETLDRLAIPYVVIGGTMEERLRQIVAHHRLPVAADLSVAIERAQRDYAALDVRPEAERGVLTGSRS